MVFQRIPGVVSTEVGYTQGSKVNQSYEQVCQGSTGHTEAVKVVYDTTAVKFDDLLTVYWDILDPTTKNRQGGDSGTQYRSAIFYVNADQKRVADAYIAQLQAAHVFGQPIMTQVTSLKGFYDAEAYHQNYLSSHPNQPYIVINDLPKIDHLKQQLPALYVSK